MKKVDQYFKAKYGDKDNMTESIKEIKEKKFLTRQKESLFKLVDNLDKVPFTAENSEATTEVGTETGTDAEAAPTDEFEKVRIFRRRLMRWKNIGVWLVVIFAALQTFAMGRISYKIVVQGVDQSDSSLHKYIILSIIFGGCSMCTQIVACLIMLSATVTMDKMRKKNNFDSSQF